MNEVFLHLFFLLIEFEMFTSNTIDTIMLLYIQCSSRARAQSNAIKFSEQQQNQLPPSSLTDTIACYLCAEMCWYHLPFEWSKGFGCIIDYHANTDINEQRFHIHAPKRSLSSHCTGNMPAWSKSPKVRFAFVCCGCPL